MKINMQRLKNTISESHIITREGGFTLVEMLVSVVIFTFVVTMATGILIVVLNANRHVHSTSMSVGFVNTVLEKMFREVSAGTSYRCDKAHQVLNGNVTKEKLSEEDTCNAFEGALVFEGVDGDAGDLDDQIIYLFDSDNNTILYSRNSGDSYERLIDDHVVIENFEIKVVGSKGSIIRQPGVFIGVHGYVEEGSGKRVTFSPQMMITQRIDPSILR